MNINRCFEILEIPPNATYEEAKAAYRIMCQVWHPDKYHHSEQLQTKATSKIKEINAAWSQIEDYFKNGFSREAGATEAERQAREERARSQQAGHDQKSETSKNETPGMIWDSEDNGFISVTCPKCSKGSRIKKSKTFKTLTGYLIYGEGICSCGFSFDRIDKIYTKTKSRNNSTNKSTSQHFMQAISDYFNRPWWVAILPFVALTLIKACKS